MKYVRESIFSSAVRSFCISFFAVIGIIIAVFLVLLIFGAGKVSKSIETSTYDFIIPDSNGRKYLFNSNDPLLLRINLNETIGMRQGVDIEDIRSILNESRTGPLKNHPIKGILLYLDTPGGGAITATSIYHAIKDYSDKYHIPVYVYVEGLCASAGYYIACAASKIYASPGSMVGSIGAYFMFFNVSETLNKVGVQNKILYRGKDKIAMNPFQPWAEGAEQVYQPLLDADYKMFVDSVAKSRPKLDVNEIVNVYGARVFTADEAEQIGLIDGANYQLSQVSNLLANAAGIQGSYQMIMMQPKMKLSDLFKIGPFSQSASIGKWLKTYHQSLLNPVSSLLNLAEDVNHP